MRFLGTISIPLLAYYQDHATGGDSKSHGDRADTHSSWNKWVVPKSYRWDCVNFKQSFKTPLMKQNANVNTSTSATHHCEFAGVLSDGVCIWKLLHTQCTWIYDYPQTASHVSVKKNWYFIYKVKKALDLKNIQSVKSNALLIILFLKGLKL